MKTKQLRKTKEEYLNEIKTGVVYIYTNAINGKKYIGQTIHPKNEGKSSRYYGHIMAHIKQQKIFEKTGIKPKISYIDQAIGKYGYEQEYKQFKK